MSAAGHGLYRGDIVTVPVGPETVPAIVRNVDGDRVRIQIGRDWTWVFSEELRWDGVVLSRVPRTERGWRKLGERLKSGALRFP